MTVPLDLDALDKQHGHRTVLGSCRECMKPGDPPIFAECDHCGGPLNAARPEENPDG